MTHRPAPPIGEIGQGAGNSSSAVNLAAMAAVMSLLRRGPYARADGNLAC